MKQFIGEETFKVPFGKTGDCFVRELTKLFRSYAEAFALESAALTAAFLVPTLPLVVQKPIGQTKQKELDQNLSQ